MAIHQRKRENLLLEATAYSRRILISLPEIKFREVPISELFAGVRPDGRWSLYFDESPVIQFDLSAHIRRVYVDNQKLAASAGSWVALKRPHQGGKVEHELVKLDEHCQIQLLDTLRDLLARTYRSLQPSDLSSTRSLIVGIVPAEDQLLFSDLLSFLSRVHVDLTIAESL